jgi:hypothetical protein
MIHLIVLISAGAVLFLSGFAALSWFACRPLNKGEAPIIPWGYTAYKVSACLAVLALLINMGAMIFAIWNKP